MFINNDNPKNTSNNTMMNLSLEMNFKKVFRKTNKYQSFQSFRGSWKFLVRHFPKNSVSSFNSTSLWCRWKHLFEIPTRIHIYIKYKIYRNPARVIQCAISISFIYLQKPFSLLMSLSSIYIYILKCRCGCSLHFAKE